MMSIESSPVESKTTLPLISLVIPVFNEEDAVAAFVEAVDSAFAEGSENIERIAKIEFIFVDDGSMDSTVERTKALCSKDSRVKLVCLSRNFGKEAALSAGLAAAGGDAAIPMDVDLQDPPNLIIPMIELWRGGAKVVNAKRKDRDKDSFFKKNSARAFYKVMNRLAEYPIAEDVGDFRLLDRAAIDILVEMKEGARFNKGLFSWIGFKTATIEFSRPVRNVGETKWNSTRLTRLAIDGVISSSTLPLRIWTIIGGLIAILAFFYAGFLIAYTLYRGADVPGYASLMVVVLFLGGLNLLSLGIMGEYVGRISAQVRGRPLYVISERVGF